MTSYKLWLAFLVLVSASVTAGSLYDSSRNGRARRARDEKERSAESSTEGAANGGYPAGYRFGDEFFLPEASKTVPAEYQKKADGCERVAKNSMVCMVCKDPKTNEKYEQCSYVGNPPPVEPPVAKPTQKKEVSYVPEASSESSETTTPSRGSSRYESSTPSRDYSTYEPSTSSRGPSNYESSTPSRDYSTYEPSTSSRGPSNYESSTPSRDYSTYEPSTSSRGPSNYESSTPSRDYSTYKPSTSSRGPSNYESSTPSRDYSTYRPSTSSRGPLNYESSTPPRDYSTYEPSTSSRGPSNYESSTSSRGPSNYESSTPSRDYSSYESSASPRDYSNYGSSTSPRSSEESEESSKPSRGGYETYEASKPEASRYGYKDETPRPYSYSGSSKEDSGSSEDSAESTNCRQVVKGSQTCNICKDPKTGKDFERCASSYKPDDKSYAYGKSERYGYPESRENDDAGYKTEEPKTEGSEIRAETADCRQVQKEHETCMVCKNPKTGGDSERCTSKYNPADKSYSYGSSARYGSSPQSGNYKSYGNNNGNSNNNNNNNNNNNSNNNDNDDKNNNKNNNNDNEDKSGDATYEIPSEYHVPYHESYDSYQKYVSSLPEEYRKPSYDDGYYRSSPSYSGSSGSRGSGEAEYASPSIPAASSKPSGGAEGCHDVRKGSLTCTVCPDSGKGGNFEKCSYAYQPDDKLYQYHNSKSFFPQAENGAQAGNAANGQAENVRQSETKQIPDAVGAGLCQKVQKNSMICTICEDPQNGGSSEQCAYGTLPSGQMFSYVASKSSGNPRNEGGQNTAEQAGPASRQESKQVPRWADEKARPIVAESQPVAQDVRSSPCQKIEKDSMSCTVCKDPATGASSEQCSYSSKPKATGYTYKKSSGNPRPAEEKPANTPQNEPQEPRETKQVLETVLAHAPCVKIETDSMICTVCKDPKTGEKAEQCAYSYKPKEKHFSYTKSKSFGKPEKNGERNGQQAQELKPEESQYVTRWTDDGRAYYEKINRPRGFSKPDWSYGE